MRLQMEMAEKLADGFSPHAAFEAKHKQSGHDQADEPVSACLGFPQRRLRIAVAAVHRLEVTMHTAFGKSGVLRKASDALLPVFTNRVENDQALGPQSHSGGPCSEGWLTWCLKSALQSTRSTTHCPALETWPPRAADGGVSSLLFSLLNPVTFVLKRRLTLVTAQHQILCTPIQAVSTLSM